jgi:hypothetical protein
MEAQEEPLYKNSIITLISMYAIHKGGFIDEL